MHPPRTIGAIIQVSLVALVALVTEAGWAGTLSDTDKEQRWAEQVIDTLFDGEAVWLSSGGHDFLGIEMEASPGPSHKALIVVHGKGVHPNWEQVVRPLRVELAESNWRTLSIQMPILENEAEVAEYRLLFDEVSPRFDAAITHLRKSGVTQIVIAAHSLGASMTSYHMALHPDSPVAALILVGLNASKSGTSVDSAADIRKINVPVLDIYGSEDLPGVIDSAPRRLEAARIGGNKNYSQVMVDGANHYFDNKEDELLNHVNGWLEDLP